MIVDWQDRGLAMHRLPELWWNGIAIQVPLPNATASYLARALVVEAESRVAPILARAMVQDPAFAFWCCAVAHELSPDESLSVRRLADLVARRGLTSLLSRVGQSEVVNPACHRTARLGVRNAQRWVADCRSMTVHTAHPSPINSGTVNSAPADSAPGEDWVDRAVGFAHDPHLLATLVGPPDRWLTLCSASTVLREFGPPNGLPESTRPGSLDRLQQLQQELQMPADDGEADVESLVYGCSWDSSAGPDWSGAMEVLTQRLGRLEALESAFAAELEHAKLTAMKELAYGAGHEINNPLANIGTRAQTLLRGERDPERRRQLATINRQVFRAHAMIADMMLFAKPPALSVTRADVGELLVRVVAELDDDVRARGISLVRAPVANHLDMLVDVDQLVVALRAICQNGIEALDTGGEIRIEARRVLDRVSREEGGEVVIEISDNGPGIPASIRPHIFDPFFSGREAGRGLGFGLAKAWRIVDGHGGRIEAESSEVQGAKFRVILPRNGPRGA